MLKDDTILRSNLNTLLDRLCEHCETNHKGRLVGSMSFDNCVFFAREAQGDGVSTIKKVVEASTLTTLIGAADGEEGMVNAGGWWDELEIPRLREQDLV
jgi:hypothetical protein